MRPKVVLAFSGGLDTSYCVKYLTQEKKMDVYAALVDTGGFDQKALEEIEKRAYKLGVTDFTVLDEVHHFYEHCVKYLIFGNILKNNTYPLSVSAERVFQAIAIAQYAQKIGASHIAHGSTGAGNDQVRFDLVFHILVPDITIITPIRDQQLSREEEVVFLQKHGIDWSWEKAQYSINQGLWGTSVGGKETLTSWEYLPDAAFPSQLQAQTPREIQLTFEKGECIKVDNQDAEHPVTVIQQLAELARPYAIGRDIHVGDTIIGIKGRVGFEAAAPLILIKAHHLLEKHVLTKWQMYWKDQLANWYGMLVHEGQFLNPVLRNIETFLDDTQQYVSGKVRVQLSPYRFQTLGIESPHDLMATRMGTYGEMNAGWSGEDVKGFTKILANAGKIYFSLHQDDMNNSLTS